MSPLGLLVSNCSPAQQPPSGTGVVDVGLYGGCVPRAAPVFSCTSAPRVSLRPQHGGTGLYGEFSELLQLFCLKRKPEQPENLKSCKQN